MQGLLRCLIASFLLLVLSRPLCGQCIVAPPAPVCTGTETLAVDGETITASVTRWFYGLPAVYAQLTLDGGTLIVCGDLTVDKLYFNTGTLMVAPGARFVIGGGLGTTLQLQGGCYVYNYGTITSHRGIALDNGHVSAAQPNIFINAGNASLLDMYFDWLVINNPYSWFVNNGEANMHGIVTDPQAAPGCVCLGPQSRTYQTVLINNAPYAYASPDGFSCLSVNEHSYLCEPVTLSPGLHACLGPAHSTDSSCVLSKGKQDAWGNASVVLNCSNCAGLTILAEAPPVSRQRPEPLTVSSISPFPNPFTDRLWIPLPSGEQFRSIVIRDVAGRPVKENYTVQINGGRVVIQFRHPLSAGIYLLQLQTNKRIHPYKIVCQ